jgi:hypothetical protein
MAKLDLKRLMWDVYNAHGPYGGKDVSECLFKHDIPAVMRTAINKTMSCNGFMTPQMILDMVIKPALYLAGPRYCKICGAKNPYDEPWDKGICDKCF